VPAGFKTDLGSIPDVFTNLIRPDSPWSSAYVVHDLLYQEVAVDRRTCDIILFVALGVPQKAAGYGFLGDATHVIMPRQQRVAIYTAVRVGGWRAYSAYRQQRIEAGLPVC
jgi:hypothetical protein